MPSILVEPGMANSEKSLKIARFGRFTFDQSAGLLKRGPVPIHLRPLAVRTLSILVQNAGSVVTHRELRQALWGNRVVEWEMGLHRLVRELRSALADDARNPRFIQTVARRGYRFCAPVESADAHDGTRRPVIQRGLWYLAGILTLPCTILGVCLYQGLVG